MEQLDLGADIEIYASMMAKALAMIHRYGEITAGDIEFGLAPPRPGMQATFSNALGDHVMWLLDFDSCKPMWMKKALKRPSRLSL